MNNNNRKVYYLFSPFLRIFHWAMVISIVILFITGLLITKPISGGTSGEPTFSNALISLNLIRNIHFTAAFIFMATFILRIYGFIINRGDRLFPRFWKASFWVGIVDITLHYLLIRPKHKPYLRNPLARASYVAIYFLIFIEVLTGLAMYFMVNPNGIGAMIFGPINSLVGGEMMTHIIHHYVAWLIIVFAMVHIYMAIRADFMEGEGEVSSMFSGIKVLEHTPVDLEDIVDKKIQHQKR